MLTYLDQETLTEQQFSQIKKKNSKKDHYKKITKSPLVEDFSKELNNIIQIKNSIIEIKLILGNCESNLHGRIRKEQNKDSVCFSSKIYTSCQKSVPETKIQPQKQISMSELGPRQRIYKLLVQLTSLASDYASGSSEASTAVNLLMLNILAVLQQAKQTVTSCTALCRGNPTLIKFYLNLTDISTRSKVLISLAMTFTFQRVPSMFSNLILTMIMAWIIVLLLPLVLMIATTAIVLALAFTATNQMTSYSWEYSKDVVKERILTRSILVSLAEQIPPSIGRVEVSHKKQKENVLSPTPAKVTDPIIDTSKKEAEPKVEEVSDDSEKAKSMQA